MTKTKKKFKSLSLSLLFCCLLFYFLLGFSSVRIVLIEHSRINLESVCNNGNRIILIETLITNGAYSFCQEQSLRDSIPFEIERSLYRFGQSLVRDFDHSRIKENSEFGFTIHHQNRL